MIGLELKTIFIFIHYTSYILVFISKKSDNKAIVAYLNNDTCIARSQLFLNHWSADVFLSRLKSIVDVNQLLKGLSQFAAICNTRCLYIQRWTFLPGRLPIYAT